MELCSVVVRAADCRITYLGFGIHLWHSRFLSQFRSLYIAVVPSPVFMNNRVEDSSSGLLDDPQTSRGCGSN